MKRGDVWRVSFDPSLGGEMRKTSPEVIVSNEAAKGNLSRVQVVPLSSRTDRLYPCESYVAVNGEMSKAMADQINTVSKQRLRARIGGLSPEDLAGVEGVMRLQLGLL